MSLFFHPSMPAQTGMTVDRISNGWLIMQLETGWHQEKHRAYDFALDGRFAVRRRMLEHELEFIDGLRTSDTTSTDPGAHFQLEEASFWLRPMPQPRPPTRFGGMERKVRPTIGRFGSGLALAMARVEGVRNTIQAYAQWLAEARDLARQHERDHEAIGPTLAYATSVHEDRSRVGEAAAVLRRRGDYPSLALEETRDREILMWVDPKDYIRAIEPYVEASVLEFIFNPVRFGDIDVAIRGMQLYASKVVPRLG